MSPFDQCNLRPQATVGRLWARAGSEMLWRGEPTGFGTGPWPVFAFWFNDYPTAVNGA